jgi:hypothetical protein
MERKEAMNEDTKQMGIGMAALVAVVVAFALMVVLCDKQRTQLGTDCIRAGRPAVECKVLMDTSR